MPGALTFLDLLVTGDEDRFVERDIRIARLAASEATEARAAIRATIPPAPVESPRLHPEEAGMSLSPARGEEVATHAVSANARFFRLTAAAPRYIQLV